MARSAAERWRADTQAGVAKFFRVSGSAVARWALDGMPGARGQYDLSEILHWLRTQGPWRPKAAPADTDDPLLAAGDSPALERYRLAKAQHAEMDLAARRAELLPTNQVVEVIVRVGGRIRKAIPMLCEPCRAVVRRAVEEADQEASRGSE